MRRHSGLSRRSVTQKLQKYALERTQFKAPHRRSPRLLDIETPAAEAGA